ncbi:MAG: M15 family metallopeptidase [Fibrobacter sp.]|nr:M15 family metallopeptidase [Fibrobacter sp.]
MPDSTGSAIKRGKPVKSQFSRSLHLFGNSLLFILSLFSLHIYGLSSGIEESLLERGLIDVKSLDSTIEVELKYADSTNFMGKAVYGNLKRCFLRPGAAMKLAEANRFLKRLRPELSLLVVDGLRPRAIQKIMWDHVKDTPMQRYVANPQWGSMHNYGCAVDITIVDSNGNRLDMGTPVDHFGPLAQIQLEGYHLKTGKLTRKQFVNRLLLRKVMTEAGFSTIPIEWWHFEAFSRKHIRETYSIVE